MPFRIWILLTDKNLCDYHFNQISGCMAVYPSLIGVSQLFPIFEGEGHGLLLRGDSCSPKVTSSVARGERPRKVYGHHEDPLAEVPATASWRTSWAARRLSYHRYVWCLGSIQLIREQPLGAALRFQMWAISDS